MASSFTTNLGLNKPGAGDPGWGDAIDADLDALDAQAALGNFAVRAASLDSSGNPAGFSFVVSGGIFLSPLNFIGNSVRTAVGSQSGTAFANATTYVWIDYQGALKTDTSYSSGGAYAPLARIVADGSNIIDIIDDRHPTMLIGAVTIQETHVNAVQPSGPTYTATSDDSYISADGFFGTVAVKLPIPKGTGRLVIVTADGAGPNGVVNVLSVDDGTGVGEVLAYPGATQWFADLSEDSWTNIGTPPQLYYGTRKITASETIGDINSYDLYRIDATGGDVTVTVPVFVNAGKVTTFKRIDSSAHTVTILNDPRYLRTIDGAASVTLAPLGVLRLCWNGHDFDVV